MGVEERNAVWGPMQVRTFIQIQSRAAAGREWSIWVDGNAVIYRWGYVGGAIQEASEKCQPVNVGKKNEISAENYAMYRAKDMIRKKVWEGYREIDAAGQYYDTPASTEIDFNNLPLNLSFYKPDNTMGTAITKKAETGAVWYSRKRNGLMYVLCKGSDTPHLYSRKMLRKQDDEQNQPWTWDERFPHIIKAAERMMPPNSILLGELVMDNNGQDDFASIQRVTKSLLPQALELQEQLGKARFYIWDVAFWNGVDLVKTAPVRVRYEMIDNMLGNPAMDVEWTALLPVEYTISSTVEDMVYHAKVKGWEGLVVVDPDGVYGDKGYNFKGKPDRPAAVCAKLKPNYEDDFIAMWNPEQKLSSIEGAVIYPKAKNATIGERSTKDRYGEGIKSVALFQYNLKGELVYISNVSSGLTERMKTDWAKPEMFPMVWKIEYKGRRYVSEGEETNALDFAAFIEVRTDKSISECVNNEL